VLFRNLKKRWGYISGVHFQKCSNFSIFFTLNISTQFFPPPNGGRRKPPKYTPELVSFNGIIWSCVGKLCIVLVAYMRHFGICRFRSAVHCTQLIKIIKNDVTNQKAVLPFYSALRDLSNDIKKIQSWKYVLESVEYGLVNCNVFRAFPAISIDLVVDMCDSSGLQMVAWSPLCVVTV